MIDGIEFVTASHNDVTLHGQLMRSPIIQQGRYAFSPVKGFTNIPDAYNSVAPIGDLMCYLHHDVFLPESFEKDLITAMQRVPDDWGVLGVAGVKLVNGKRTIHGHISDRGKQWGSPWNLPAEVDTLDEMLLITRCDLMFDPQFAQDFYGADLCMQARELGKKCYAISAYCEHNSSRQVGGRTAAFYEAEKLFKRKWKDRLPIVTTCSILTDGVV